MPPPPKPQPSVREFIEAALAFSGWKCEDCQLPLELVWFGEEDAPILQYVRCKNCEAEYVLMISFIKEKTVPPEQNL
jgi:hypothetical protein